MRKYLLHVLIISFVFLYPLILHARIHKAENGRGIEIVIRDKQGKQVGIYKGSHALVIGVSDYKTGWPDLENIPREIVQVEEALNKHKFNIVKVMNPDSEALENAFKDFINKYGYDEQNRLLFFYTGHGYSRKDGKKGYLVPVDAPNPQDDDIGFVQKALNMNQILTWSRNLEAKHALFLFDSCFSGVIFKTKTRPIPKHISKITSRPVRQFISAGGAGEKVPAKSVFTPSFVRGLDGEADSDKDGYITGTELGSYLYKKVLYYDTGQTPQYGKIRDPELDEGDFVFALGRDVYEQLSKPKVVEEFDFGDIEKKRKKLQEEREVKTEWTKWQKKFDAAYDEALRYDRDTDLKAGDKAKVWKRLANGFSQDNPYSTEDQLIRSKAVERMEYWRNYREPMPAVTIQEEPSYGGTSITKLRSSYKTLSVSQVQSIPNISIRKEKDYGFYGHSTISHNYEKRSINGDGVVIDHATGLMWHQNGFDDGVKWNEAKEWVRTLNGRGYAGYQDWRLPTLEEAASLLESNKRNDLYIDPIFSKRQGGIWTGDSKDAISKNKIYAAWRVLFLDGFVHWIHINSNSCVRPVRSVE
jgi:hypothetical protein